MVNSVWAMAQFSGSGSGTSTDPYKVYNPIQLDQMRNFLGQDGVCFKIMNDIDLTDYIADNNPSQGWQPIGSSTEAFEGIVDGNNCTISGLWINRSTDNVGFFGYLTGATIENLKISGTTIKGGNRVGTFAGQIQGGTITGCSTSFTSVSGTQYIGGFASTAFSNVSIANCNAVGSVVSTSNSTGGFVGICASVSISNCSHKGNVSGTGYVGGFVGYQNNINNVSNSKHEGDVTGSAYSVGGFVGYSNLGSSFISCSTLSKVKGTYMVGGFGGEILNNTIENCGHNGDIIATSLYNGISYAGGVVGSMENMAIGDNSRISNCYSIGNISAKGNATGGIVGGVRNTSKNVCPIFMKSGDLSEMKRLDVIINQEISFQTYRFRVIGLSKYYSKKNFSGQFGNGNYSMSLLPSSINVYWKYGNTRHEVGDSDAFSGFVIVGCTCYTDMVDCGIWSEKRPFSGAGPNTSGSWPSGYDYVYAIVRSTDLLSYPWRLIINNNYYSGDINAADCAGGVIGDAEGAIGTSEISKNYAAGNIYAKNKVGGLIGNIDVTSSTSVTSNMAIMSNIAGGSENVNRAIGLYSSSVTISASGTTSRNYAMTQAKVSKEGVEQKIEDNLYNGDSRGSSTLKLQATYQGIGWEFDNPWKIQETESYPYNKLQTAPPVFTSKLVSGATTISGKSVDGGTVYVNINGNEYSTTTSANTWSVTVPALESGTTVYAYSKSGNLDYSYRTIDKVQFAGTGTEADPYLVYTASDLAHINSASYYKLMNNIDVSSYIAANSPTAGWQPIGRSSATPIGFDGNGKTISGLWTNTTSDYTGLFTTITNAVVKDLTINVASGKKVIGGSYTGILAGSANNTSVSNLTIIGDVRSASGNYVGGAIGSISGTTPNNIDNVKLDVSATGQDYVGGLAGKLSATALNKINVEGHISGKSYTGGVVGYSTSAISESYFSGEIQASGINTGGIAGSQSSSITKCYFDGTMSSSAENSNIGGIAGVSTSGSVSLCYSTGEIISSAQNSFEGGGGGGIVGSANGASVKITNCYSHVDITSPSYTGGIAGYSKSQISNCYASGNISSLSVAAGIVGYLNGASAKVTNSVASNTKVSVSTAQGTVMRVIGGYTNGATDPTMADGNIALKTMAVSVNNVAQIIYDDPLEGAAVTQDKLYQQATYSAKSWDFNEVWAMPETEGYPILQWAIETPEPDFTLGDVNGDGNISVTDAVAVVNFILGNNVEGLSREAADVNGDGEITVTDEVGVVNMILNNGGSSAASKAFADEATSNLLTIDNVIAEDNNNIRVMIKSLEDDITASQFDIILPPGVVLEDINAADRCHSVSYNDNNGIIKVVCYSFINDLFRSGNIAELCLKVVSDDAVSIDFSNIELTRPDLSNVCAKSQSLNADSLTGIKGNYHSSTKTKEAYDLNGRKVKDSIRKGTYIINGKKVKL